MEFPRSSKMRVAPGHCRTDKAVYNCVVCGHFMGAECDEGCGVEVELKQTSVPEYPADVYLRGDPWLPVAIPVKAVMTNPFFDETKAVEGSEEMVSAYLERFMGLIFACSPYCASLFCGKDPEKREVMMHQVMEIIDKHIDEGMPYVQVKVMFMTSLTFQFPFIERHIMDADGRVWETSLLHIESEEAVKPLPAVIRMEPVPVVFKQVTMLNVDSDNLERLTNMQQFFYRLQTSDCYLPEHTCAFSSTMSPAWGKCIDLPPKLDSALVYVPDPLPEIATQDVLDIEDMAE